MGREVMLLLGDSIIAFLAALCSGALVALLVTDGTLAAIQVFGLVLVIFCAIFWFDIFDKARKIARILAVLWLLFCILILLVLKFNFQ